MKGTITEERLIELAEGAVPTVEEQKLLDTNAGLQETLHDYQAVFSGLRNDDPPEESLAGILPGVRAAIASTATAEVYRPEFSSPVRSMLAAAAAAVLVLGLLLMTPGQETDILVTQDSYAYTSLEESLPILATESLQLELTDYTDVELFSDLNDVVDSTDEFLDGSTFNIYEEALSLDDEAYDRLVESMKQDTL